uniref:Variant surface glycoprotein 1125.1733 n=1 Tax=Trypanosoma brucei TaxID=5691 RepID=A0A1J0R7T3_9TRYP|nr:variant surface glycoprotein 1125.1733 [Trypanosoma brucei]
MLKLAPLYKGAMLLIIAVATAAAQEQEEKQDTPCNSALYLLQAAKQVKQQVQELTTRQERAISDLKTAIISATAAGQPHRGAAAIPMALALNRLTTLATRLKTCVDKGGELQRRLATLAGLHLGIAKTADVQTTANPGQALDNAAVQNNIKHVTTVLTKVDDNTCETTADADVPKAEQGVDITKLQNLKTYKLQQAAAGDSRNICGATCTKSGGCGNSGFNSDDISIVVTATKLLKAAEETTPIANAEASSSGAGTAPKSKIRPELANLKKDMALALKQWKTEKYCEDTTTETPAFEPAAASDLQKQQHFIATGHVTEDYSKLTHAQKETLGNEIKTTYNAGKDSFRNGLWKNMTEEKITANFGGTEVTGEPKTISGDDDKVVLEIAALLATTKNGQASAGTKTESTETKSDPTDKTGENKNGDKKEECAATKEGKCDTTNTLVIRKKVNARSKRNNYYLYRNLCSSFA